MAENGYKKIFQIAQEFRLPVEKVIEKVKEYGIKSRPSKLSKLSTAEQELFKRRWEEEKRRRFDEALDSAGEDGVFVREKTILAPTPSSETPKSKKKAKTPPEQEPSAEAPPELRESTVAHEAQQEDIPPEPASVVARIPNKEPTADAPPSKPEVQEEPEATMNTDGASEDEVPEKPSEEVDVSEAGSDSGSDTSEGASPETDDSREIKHEEPSFEPEQASEHQPESSEDVPAVSGMSAEGDSDETVTASSVEEPEKHEIPEAPTAPEKSEKSGQPSEITEAKASDETRPVSASGTVQTADAVSAKDGVQNEDSSTAQSKNRAEASEKRSRKGSKDTRSDDKKNKKKSKRRSGLPAPEVSASPAVEKSRAVSGQDGKKSAETGPQLGPTGRKIPLERLYAQRPELKKKHKEREIQQRVQGTQSQAQRYEPSKEERELYNKIERQKHRGRGGRRDSRERGPKQPPSIKRHLKLHEDETLTVSALSQRMGIKAAQLMKTLLGLGKFVNINSILDTETIEIAATEYGFEVEIIAHQEGKLLDELEEQDDPATLEPRPPVVTIMGHVDHGKTTLLDRIRKSDIASKEAGGITQHIGAYRVKTSYGEIVFIDTPGHEAFSSMRARGADVTDIVVLVVAADDGVMPQTIEAINHAKHAKVPIIVAITKVDKNNANVHKVREELVKAELVPEEWGGDTIILEVSAYTGQGVEELLEYISLQAEMLELKANPNKPAKAVVLEAKLDPKTGPKISVLVQQGTLHKGDFALCGPYGGKVRTMMDDRGRMLGEAGPATPVEITGFDGVPEPGEDLRVIPDEKMARKILEKRKEQSRQKELERKARISKGLDAITEAIARGEQKYLNIILKTDVQGTMEAIRESLMRLSNDRVKVNVIHAGVGGVNESDVNLAVTASALIMGFHVRPNGPARRKAEKEGVEIRIYNVIYDLLDDVKDLMRGLLPKEKREEPIGTLEVLQVFHFKGVGTVAGCMVSEGKITSTAHVRVIRDDVQIHEGKIATLKHFKDDVKEVVQGKECGLTIESYNDLREGDVIEAYEVVEVTPEL